MTLSKNLPKTLLEAKTIHAYAAAVSLAVVFNVVGMIGVAQVLGATLFFGFVSLLDELADLSKSISRVNDQLAKVTKQLTRVNDDDRTPPRDRDREPADDQDRTRDRERV